MIYDITILFFNILLIILFICASITTLIFTIYFLLVYIYTNFGYYLSIYMQDVKDKD